MSDVTIERIRAFWDANPVAAEGIDATLGTPEFYHAFDALREADGCEPYPLSDRIHGYSRSGGKRVLDVGCGNGYVLFQYARHGAEVHGVDLTSTAVQLSRTRFELAGLTGTFQEIDGTHLPYPDAHFDIVCSMGVLHHIVDPRPLIAEMHRVLKPGGALIVMLYHRYSWKNLVVLRLRRLLDPAYRGKSQQQALNMNDGPECPLALVYSKQEAANLFGEFSGLCFELNQLSWRQLFLLPPLAKLGERFLPPSSKCWPARHLGWNLYATGKKPA